MYIVSMKRIKNGVMGRISKSAALGFLFAACLAFPGILFGQDAASVMTLPAYSVTEALAANGVDPLEASARTSKLHSYLGYATILAGIAAIATGPERDDGESEGNVGLHSAFAYSSAALGAATIGAGFWAHKGEVVGSGASMVNIIHATLGIAGGTMMIAAPFLAPADIHKVLGEAGAALMGASVVWSLMM